MKTEGPPITPPAPASSKPAATSAPSELSDVRRSVGQIITARILSAQIKSEQSIEQTRSQTAQTLNMAGSAGTRLSPDARAVQQFSANQQLGSPAAGSNIADTTAANLNRLWQIVFQVQGYDKPLTTEINATRLPADWVAGKLLSLQVIPGQGLKVLPGPEQATQQLEQSVRNLSQALSRWLPLQADMRSTLSLLHSSSNSPAIPEPVRQSLNSLFTNVMAKEQAASPSPASIRQAMQQSGTAMEANLLKQLTGSENRPATAPPTPSAAAGATESALTRLLPADLKALVAATLNATLQQLAQSGAQGLPRNWEAAVNWLTQQVANFSGGGHPLAFPSTGAQPAARQTSNADAGEILRALAQTLARIQVNQLNAVQQTLIPSADGNQNQVWFVELPVQGQRLENIQLRLEKETASEQEERQQKTRWKLVLSFELDHLGPFQSHVFYTHGTVSATFWAEQQHTLQTVTSELPRLRKGLKDWGLEVGELTVRKGTPPPPQSPLSRQLIDERA